MTFKPNAETGRAHRLAVHRAVAYMQDNLGNPHADVKGMARAAVISKYHFHRVFKDVTGRTPRDYLTWLRVCEAAQLLEATSLPLTEICDRVGRLSVGTFSSRFRALVGVAPSLYREAVRMNRVDDRPIVLMAARLAKKATQLAKGTAA